jgi:galactosamine-6-phosphate isomerase
MLAPTVLADHEAVSTAAAVSIAARLESKPHALLCLATGSTPLRTYEILARHGRAAPCLTRFMKVIKLDEWGGLAMERPGTCETFLRNALVTPLGLDSRYVGFNSNPANPAAECARIRDWLAANGPIDTAILGLGLNGHLGFNEPDDALQPHAHIATLSPESLRHSMLANEPERPAFGLTLGMTDIFHARRILLLVTGKAKRDALRRLTQGPITARFPASFLHLHPEVTLLVDAAAAGRTR